MYFSTFCHVLITNIVQHKVKHKCEVGGKSEKCVETESIAHFCRHCPVFSSLNVSINCDNSIFLC